MEGSGRPSGASWNWGLLVPMLGGRLEYRIPQLYTANPTSALYAGSAISRLDDHRRHLSCRVAKLIGAKSLRLRLDATSRSVAL